ncbi:MAG: hypothetical protein WAL85_00630 [Candidatus Korobacteraceae bacterium]
MSAQFTLLLLCDQREPYFLFIAALKSAGFQVLIARTAVRAKRFLSDTTVGAILILDSDCGDGNAIGKELKRMAPGTPILLRGEENQERQPGIDSFWQADLEDEVVANAVAMFFQQSLMRSRPASVAHRQAGKKEVASAGAGQQPA